MKIMITSLQQLHELGVASTCINLYLDVETTTGGKAKYSGSPYSGDEMLGIAFTYDNEPRSFYIPLLHKHGNNVQDEDLIGIFNHIAGLIRSCTTWANHNIKFDMHFISKYVIDLSYDAPEPVMCDFACTLTLQKLINSDMIAVGGYGLGILSKAVLNEDISEHEEAITSYLKAYKIDGKSAVSYEYVPSDIMTRYACEDVLITRRLYQHQLEALPEESTAIWDIERRLTPILFDAEKHGMTVDLVKTSTETFITLHACMMIEQRLHELLGETFVPSKPSDCQRILIQKFGLPVVELTDSGYPSFSSGALTTYSRLPVVISNPSLTEVVKLAKRYRELITYHGLFLLPYKELSVDGVMHPDYNQVIQTGRMSCRRPNAQQLSKEAKNLIVPSPGHRFVSVDYSQIEFRLIAHYLNNLEIIRAYEKDPDTDFHQWVANISGMKRSAAKNVNFCIGYGGGKQKVLAMLAHDPTVIETLSQQIVSDAAAAGWDDKQRDKEFNQRCIQKAEDVYDEYHKTLPTLRVETRRAASRATSIGYVRTAYKRRRYLPQQVAWRAFNSVIQGTAADVIKDVTTRIAPRFNARSRELGIKLIAQVHDENLFEIPLDGDMDAIISHITTTMEAPQQTFTIPMRVCVSLAPTPNGGWGTVEKLTKP